MIQIKTCTLIDFIPNIFMLQLDKRPNGKEKRKEEPNEVTIRASGPGSGSTRCQGESVQGELDDHEKSKKLVNLSLLQQVETPEHEKVKDSATSLHCRQLFINAFSGPSIIHQCANNKGGEGCSPRCCFTKVMTMKPDGRG